MTNEYPIIDAESPSWADVSVRVSPNGGQLIAMGDIAQINTSTTVEVGEQRGASGGRVLRRTTGSESSEASMTLYRSGHTKLLRALIPVAQSKGFVRGNQVRISLVKFDIQVQHTPPDSDEIYEFVIKGCRVTGRTNNNQEGTDPNQVEVPLHTMQIVDIIDGVEVCLL